MGIRRQQSGLVIIIWGGMIGNELTSLFREPEELNCPLTRIAQPDLLSKSYLGNLILAQRKKIIFLRGHVHA